MSRLAEILIGLDRKASRRAPAGGFPRLLVGEVAHRRWRIAAPVLGLALLATLGLAVMARLPSGAPPAPPKAASVLESAPAPKPGPAQGGESFPGLMRQGLEAAGEGAFGEAARLFERALALNPVDAEGWNNLGVVLIRQGDAARGIEAFRRALRLNPAHAEAHRNLAVALERRGRPREADGHYRAFLALSGGGHPDRAEVRRRLGEAGGRKAEE